jgi:pSer/pThr/pTyr-binding forkhead associated (FHA) protein
MAADLNRAALLYRSGPPRDFPLPPAEATLGFGGGDVIRIPMEGVSRRHAKIFFDGKDYWIEDAGSSNGTFVNGVRLTKRERLRHLDVITLGRHTDLIFALRTRDAGPVTRNGIKSACIEAVDGTDAGTRWAIPRGSITIGRAPSNNVVIDSQLVSKMHARLECTGLQLVVTDLHSHNGTYVDGEKLVEPRILKEGDELVLAGARRFRVHIEEGSIEASGVGPLPLQARSEAALPMDWQTRMEWAPDELASFERGRKGDTGLREAAPRIPAPEAKPAAAEKPPATPGKPAEVKPPPAAAKPEVKPAAAAPKAEVKPPAEAPKPEAKPTAAGAKPAEVAAAAPKAEVKPPLVAPGKAAEVKPPPAPAKPEVKPAAAPEKPEAKQPAEAPKPEAKPAAAAAKPEEVSPAAPQEPEVKPPAAAATAEPKSPPVPERLEVGSPVAQKPKETPAALSPKAEVKPPAPAPSDVEGVREKPEPKPAQAAPAPTPILSELPKRPAVRVSGEATRALVEAEKSKPRVYFEGEAQTLPLATGEHEIGRLPGMSIRLDTHKVSRRHAIIHVSNAEVVVEDLGSHNGTFVNGERITAPRKLNPGDLVHFGDVAFRVRFPAQGKPEIEQKPQ